MRPAGARCSSRTLGYTVTELMLVVTIIGVVFVIAPTLLVNMTRFFRQNQARITIQREAREALDLINRNLRQAQASSITVDTPTGQPPHSRITFTRLKPNGTTSTIIFYKQGKTLYMVEGGTRAISTNLRYVAFTYQDSREDSWITVSLTTESGTYEAKTKALHLSVEKVRIMND